MGVSSQPRAHAFFGGLIRLVDNPAGHRAGTEGVLLAATAPPHFSGHLVDAGTGAGVVGLGVIARCPEARASLIDIDGASCALTRANAERNGLAERAQVIEADLMGSLAARLRAGVPDREADLVLTNPPFFPSGRVRLSPDPDRVRAHVFSDADLGRWMTAIDAMLKPRGGFVMIHRPESLAAILAACAGKFGALSILPIHARRDRPATRILVGGRKGSRAPLSIRQGFTLHEVDGSRTPESDAVARGQALIDFM
jgi:tRNA1(Val) A37 N6-methylase TrmN6